MGQKQAKSVDTTPKPSISVSTIPNIQYDWGYTCNDCAAPITGTRYVCWQCYNYDLCPKCYKRKGHDHLVYKEDKHPQEYFDKFYSLPTTGQVLLAMFEEYKHRYALGFRPPLKNIGPNPLGKSSEEQLKQGMSENSISINQSDNLTPLNPYKYITFGELGERVKSLANALVRLIKPRSFASFCTPVQLGGYIADYACQVSSIVCPSISPTSSNAALLFVINSTKMELIFATITIVPRLLEIAPQCPTLKFIVQIEPLEDYQISQKTRSITLNFIQTCKDSLSKKKPINDETPLEGQLTLETTDNSETNFIDESSVEEWKNKILKASTPALLDLDQLILLGQNLKWIEPTITPENEIETLVYTSGSTGIPKGAIFTAKAWKNQLVHKRAKPGIDLTVSWSTSDRKNDYRHLYYGGCVAIYNGDMGRIFEDIGEVKPHNLNATPAFWNKLYAEFKAMVSDEVDADTDKDTKEEILERIYEQMRQLVGDRVVKIVTGGAPTSVEVLNWLRRCFNCSVSESYGSTECGGIVSQGLFLASIQWKIVPWEEYKPSDLPFPRGELCVKRDDMMSGYFADEENTKEALDSEGYYHTGDIVQLNLLRTGCDIIDRKKNIFKLSQGEYVAPAKIEKALIGHSKFIKQAFVYGDSLKSSLVAIIYPHFDQLLEHLNEKLDNNSPLYTFPSVAGRKEATDLILGECARIGRDLLLRSFEIPAAIVLSTEEFTKENGLHTQSEKPARHALFKHFKDEIDILYRDLDLRFSDTKAAVMALLGQPPTKKKKGLKNSSSNNNEPVSSTIPDKTEEGDPEESLTHDKLSLVQMGGDSLSAIKLRNLIQKNFSISLPVGVLLNPNTDLLKIASYIDESQRDNGKTLSVDQFSAPPVDLQTLWRDSRLNPDWKYAVEKPKIVTDLSKYKCVLLTGASGFLGTAFLAELLKSTSAEIICLVRKASDSPNRKVPVGSENINKSKSSNKSSPTSSIPSNSELESLEERILSSKLLGSPENLLKTIKKPFHQRVKVIEGSLDKHHFGLSDESWKQLQNTVEIIFHVGAYVNSILPYHRLAPSNVEGTRTCIELCTAGKSKLLVHVSTNGVLSSSYVRTETPVQTNLPQLYSQLLTIGGYNLSKYIAEMLVWEAVDRGFPCLVIRPGFIGSGSRTGFANVNDFDNRLLVGLTKLGYVPTDNEVPLITMPVDFLCNVVMEMIRHEENFGSVFHFINNSSELSLSLITQALESKGFVFEKITYVEWQKRLQLLQDDSNPIYTMVEEYFSRPYFHTRRAGLPNQKMLDFVKSKTKIKLPQTNLEYVLKWIEWLVDKQLIQLPSPKSNKN